MNPIQRGIKEEGGIKNGDVRYSCSTCSSSSLLDLVRISKRFLGQKGGYKVRKPWIKTCGGLRGSFMLKTQLTKVI